MSIRDTGECLSSGPLEDAYKLLYSALVMFQERGVPSKISTLGEGDVDFEWDFLLGGAVLTLHTTAWGDGDYKCYSTGYAFLPRTYKERAVASDILEAIAAYLNEETML